MTAPSALDPSGTYCCAAGHARHGCPGSGPLHHELYALGYGISTVPGPSDAELRAETEADSELMADEWHGRDLDGAVVW